MNISRLLTLMTAFFFVSAPIASAQISNGGFDDSTGYFDIVISTELGFFVSDNLGTASPWTFGPNAGIAIGQSPIGGSAWLFPSPSPSSDAFVSQTFSLDDAGSFSIEWDSFADASQIDPSYSVDLSAADGGDSLFTSNFQEDPSDGLSTSHLVQFDAAPGTYTLTFTGSVGDIFIDNVNITAVPEPGSALLVTLAGMSLFLRRRRRCHAEI